MATYPSTSSYQMHPLSSSSSGATPLGAPTSTSTSSVLPPLPSISIGYGALESPTSPTMTTTTESTEHPNLIPHPRSRTYSYPHSNKSGSSSNSNNGLLSPNLHRASTNPTSPTTAPSTTALGRQSSEKKAGDSLDNKWTLERMGITKKPPRGSTSSRNPPRTTTNAGVGVGTGTGAGAGAGAGAGVGAAMGAAAAGAPLPELSENESGGIRKEAGGIEVPSNGALNGTMSDRTAVNGHAGTGGEKDGASVKGARKIPTTKESLKAIYRASWLNVLIVFVPISWALHFALPHTNGNDTVIFLISFIAIVPLAKLLAWGTEELALYFGEVVGGLLNATFGNVVELIVGVIALTQCKLNVVQSSLVGSILSNLLLVLGMCFFAGGTRFSEQGFLQTAAQLNTSLLLLSVTAILIPAAYNMVQGGGKSAGSATGVTINENDVLKMSHGIAIILLLIYIANLLFQLWSHANLYSSEQASKGKFQSSSYPQEMNNPAKNLRKRVKRMHTATHNKYRHHEVADEETGTAPLAHHAHHGVDGSRGHTRDHEHEHTHFGNEVAHSPSEESDETASRTTSKKDDDAEEEEVPKLSSKMALALLAVATVLVAVTAEFLVSSIDGLTASGNISEEWVGLILLPIVGNAAEHVTAVTVSIKDKIDLSIGVAVGSSIQIALFVIPVLVLLAWCLGKPLTLLFDPLESIVLFLAVLTVAYCTNDGRSNWLEGMILMSLYVIIATAFWWYPGTTANC